MPTLEKENYLIHYNEHPRNEIDITSVEVYADGEINAKKEKVWVWADSLPDNVRDFIYNEAFKMIQRSR